MWKLILKFKLWLESYFKDFIFKNYYFRRVRSYINLVLIPYLIKGFFLLLTIILLSYFTLKIFKPNLLDKGFDVAKTYSDKYLNLDKYAFTSIRISGVKRSDRDKIIKIVKDIEKNRKSRTKPNSLISEISKEIKLDQDWVKELNVFRSLPNKLNIIITEYVPFAIWENGAEKYIIDRDGNKVKVDSIASFEHLIILSGKNANLNVKSLFNILAISPEISSRVYSATWIGNRRWDIRFENGLLIKLPSENLEEAWQRLMRLYGKKGALINLKIIDLRIFDKTYLEYKSKK